MDETLLRHTSLTDPDGDIAAPVRVFQDFLGQYHTILSTVELYLTDLIEKVPAGFAQAYQPWQKAVRDLLQGVYMVARRIPLRNPKALADALRLFSLESAVSLLHDVCTSCHIRLPQEWRATFQRSIQNLSQAFRQLMQQRALGKAF